MAGIFAFKCSHCGAMHEGSPSFGYDAPWHYEQLSEAERAQAKLTSDTCEIHHDEGTDYFIRAVVEIPVHGVAEPFLWGVWVSLSEKRFERYIETWDNPDEHDAYFGWFCNRLPWYSETLGLKTMAHPRKEGVRPWLEIERNGHLLAEHLNEGISVQLAQEIAECALHHYAATEV
jgi:hypothetical protein